MPFRRHQQRNLHEPPALPQRRHGCLNTDAALRYEAARHGCALFDVHRDGACQFHALKHACTYQLRPARAVEYDATGMRDAILDALADDELLNRFWVGESDADAVQAGSLRTKLEENVRAEYGCTLRAAQRDTVAGAVRGVRRRGRGAALRMRAVLSRECRTYVCMVLSRVCGTHEHGAVPWRGALHCVSPTAWRRGLGSGCVPGGAPSFSPRPKARRQGAPGVLGASTRSCPSRPSRLQLRCRCASSHSNLGAWKKGHRTAAAPQHSRCTTTLTPRYCARQPSTTFLIAE